MDRVREIQQRVEKATGGKWWFVGDQAGVRVLRATRISPHTDVIRVDDSDILTGATLEIRKEDEAFITHSREDIPYLLSRLQAAEQERDELKDAMQCRNTRAERRAEAAESRIQSLTEAQRWIPVSEKLPNHGIGVLIVDSGRVLYGWYRSHVSEKSAKWDSHRGVMRSVTHWCPLPLPPADASVGRDPQQASTGEMLHSKEVPPVAHNEGIKE